MTLPQYDPKLAPLVVRAAEVEQSLSVTTGREYARAIDLLRSVQTMRDTVRAFFKPMKEAAHKAHKAIVAREAEHLAPLERAERCIKDAMIAFTAEQARLAAIERERLLADARAREEERRLQLALAMEAEAQISGDAALQSAATALIDAPLDLPVVDVAPAVPTVAGISYQTRWHAVVDDLRALVTFVATQAGPIDALAPNYPWLHAQARLSRGAITYPGVRFVETQSVRAAADPRMGDSDE